MAMNPGQPVPPQVFLPSCSRREPLGVSETDFLQVGRPFYHQIISVKALKGAQSINPNQWPGLILSSSTARLMMEWVLLPLTLLGQSQQ